jgi:hypothetical protein
LVNTTVHEFYFDEFFEITKSPFGGEGGCDGGGLVGGDGPFGVIGNGTTAAGFYGFNFDGTGTEVEQLEFGFCGFWRFNITEVVGGLKPLHLWECVLGVVQSDVHGFIDDGTCTGFGDGFHHGEIPLEYEFNDFVVGRFEVGFFHKGTWGNVVGIEDNGNGIGGEVFNLGGEYCGDTVTIGLDLRNIKIVEGVIPYREHHFYHITHVGIDFHDGTSQYFYGLIEGLLGTQGSALE